MTTTLQARNRSPSEALRVRGVWEGGHLPALDGIRGLAILIVLIHHLSVLPGITLLSLRGMDVSVLGATGVDLFFVLSGFLITGILLDSKQQPHYFRNFYARRTLRIFPLYYAVVFIALIVLPRLPHGTFDRFRDPEQTWSYWLYLSNFSMALGAGFRHGVLDVTWSLAIEEQFYLLWPLVVLMLKRRTLFRLCVGMLGVAIALRSGLVLAGAQWELNFLLTPCRWDGLVVGALIAVVSRAHGVACLLRPARRVALICAPLLLIVLARGLDFYRTSLGQCLGTTLIVLIFGALLVEVLAAREGSRLQNTMSWPWLRMFGKYSYALYLTHVPILAGMYQTLYGRDGTAAPSLLRSTAGQLLFCLMAVGACLAVAWVSWHLFEKHFLSLKRYFPSRRPARFPAAEHVWRPIDPPEAVLAAESGFRGNP